MKKLILTLSFAACTWLIQAAGPTMVGHRGSAYGVENTAEAVRNGAAMGCEYVESDIRVTADGQIVLCHDDSTVRLGGRLEVASATLDELRAEILTQTYGDSTYTARIMTLDEWLALCDTVGVRPLIELKWSTGINSHDFTNIPQLIEIIDAHNARGKCIIITSMKPCLEYIREHWPDITLQFLTSDKWADSFDWCVRLGIGADIRGGCFVKEDVDRFHEAGLPVNVWTIDNPEDAARYAEWGVDFITTNRLTPQLTIYK